jgi:hypothetical protein
MKTFINIYTTVLGAIFLKCPSTHSPTVYFSGVVFSGILGVFKLPKLLSADLSAAGSWDSVSNALKSGGGGVVIDTTTGGADCGRPTSTTSCSGVDGCDKPPDNTGDIVKYPGAGDAGCNGAILVNAGAGDGT